MSSGVIIIKKGKKYRTKQNNNSHLSNIIGNLENKELITHGKNIETFIINKYSNINYYLFILLFLCLLIVFYK
jgi:hypothetical protein